MRIDDQGGGRTMKGGSEARQDGAAGQRAGHRVLGDSMEILDRVSEALANQNGLTLAGATEIGAAIDDIAGRLERVAEVVAQLMDVRKPEAAYKQPDLTVREQEILGHLADGKTNVEIATHCWISENTVKFHVKNLFRKLEVHDRSQAMMVAKGVRRTGHELTARLTATGPGGSVRTHGSIAS
jgi:DNA-binding CsgD family transcriptional regulator